MSSAIVNKLLAALAAVAIAAGGGVRADDADRDASAKESVLATGYVEQVNVALTLVEVVVVDRRGNHISGLGPEDFVLKEGRRPVRLLTFDEIDLRPSRPDDEVVDAGDEEGAGVPPARQPAALPGDATASGVISAGQTARERQKGLRWFVLLFDGFNNPSPLRISRARRAAKTWMRENLREGDRVAVYEVTPYLYTVKGFSSNPATLAEAVDSVRIMPSTSMAEDVMRSKLESSDYLTEDQAKSQLRNAARFGASLAVRERDQFYRSITNLAKAIAPLEGTKTVVLFSGGFPLTRTWDTEASGGLTPVFKEMLNILTWYGIRVFTFDTGEDGAFAGADRDETFRQMVDNLGLGAEWADDLQIGAQIDALNAHHEILAVLGNETGGRFFKGNDFSRGLESVDADLSHYYLLGYEPVDPVLTRNFVYLDVDVPDIRGAKAIARRGRFLRPIKAAERRETVRETPAEPRAVMPTFDVDGDITTFPAPDGKTLATLSLLVRGGALKTLGASQGSAKAPERLSLVLDVEARLRGVVIEEMTRTIALPLDARSRPLAAEGLSLREALVLPPGEFEFEARIRADDGLGQGLWTRSARVPSYAPEKLGLTDVTVFDLRARCLPAFDVFVSRQPVPGSSASAMPEDPLGSAAGRPMAAIGTVFPKELPLLLQVGVLNPPPPGPGGESRLALDWELIEDGAGSDPVAPPVQYRRLELSEDGRRLDVVASLDLGGLAPGAYRLRLMAREAEGSGRAVRAFDVEIR